MNTAPIREAFAAMMVRVMAYVQSAVPLRKKALRISRLARLGQLLLAMERYNSAVISKASMLGCTVWCRRVFYELGGWPEVYRWQARCDAFRARGLNPSYGKHKSAPHNISKTRENQKAQRTARVIKTDAANQFCWAQFAREPSGSGSNRTAGIGVSYPRNYDIPPIGIYPCEFIEALHPEREENSQPASGDRHPAAQNERRKCPPDYRPNLRPERPDTGDPPS